MATILTAVIALVAVMADIVAVTMLLRAGRQS